MSPGTPHLHGGRSRLPAGGRGLAKITLPEPCQPGGPLAWTWPSWPQARPYPAGMRKLPSPSLYDAARAGWGLSCPTSLMSLASAPWGPRRGRGDGVTRPATSAPSPQVSQACGIFLFIGKLFKKILCVDFRERERKGRESERDKHQFVVPLIYAFIG